MTSKTKETKSDTTANEPFMINILTSNPERLWILNYNQYVGYDILQGPVNPTLISPALPDITLRSFDSLLIK